MAKQTIDWLNRAQKTVSSLCKTLPKDSLLYQKALRTLYIIELARSAHLADIREAELAAYTSGFEEGYQRALVEESRRISQPDYDKQVRKMLDDLGIPYEPENDDEKEDDEEEK